MPALAPASTEFRRDLLRHLPALFAHARRLARDPTDSEDLVQATVVRALSFAATFTPGTNLRAWLHQVLDSVFLSGCRRRTRERRALSALESDPCAWVRPESVAPMLALSPPVEAALSRLPPCFAEVVRLVDVEDVSYRDAALRLDVPLGTVMSRLHRGRRSLAQALTDDRSFADEPALGQEPTVGEQNDSASARAAA